MMNGCELLSKISIFDIRNNPNRSERKKSFVVNCSQKLVSLTSETTSQIKMSGLKWL